MNQATIGWRGRRGPGERPPVERRDPVASARRRPLRDRRPLHPCPAPAGARPGGYELLQKKLDGAVKVVLTPI